MKKKGKGIAVGLYPTGFTGGGDPSHAIIKIKPDGTADLIVGSTDVGQGCKTVLAQMAAEELGIGYDQVNVLNRDTDTCPHCAGTIASRVTYMTGNAVVNAARQVRSILFEVAAEDLNVSPKDLVAQMGKIFVRGSPERCVDIDGVANKAMYELGKALIGHGYFMRPVSKLDPATGKIDPFTTLAWTAVQAEVEVDTETGVVDVLKLTSVVDAGKAINPMLVEGQIEGGAVMGMGAALMEHLHPYYPALKWQPENLGDYVIPTVMDVPELVDKIYECPSTGGPYGVKGIGEFTANAPSPAIMNAVYDAVGVWIDKLPITPERVLRALDLKKKQAGR
jgi:CO/xanthine dehydrogenase Mo-binding subunit